MTAGEMVKVFGPEFDVYKGDTYCGSMTAIDVGVSSNYLLLVSEQSDLGWYLDSPVASRLLGIKAVKLAVKKLPKSFKFGYWCSKNEKLECSLAGAVFRPKSLANSTKSIGKYKIKRR